MSAESITVGILSDLDPETLEASGRYGRVYQRQLTHERAQDSYESASYTVERELSGKLPPLGSSTTDMFFNHPAIREAQVRVDETRKAMIEAQDEVGGITFLPAVENLPEIEKRLASLNRKAGKLGTDEITLTITDERLLLNYKTNDEDTRGYDFEHVFVVLHGTTPKIPGFEFLATITPTEHGNIVKRIPPIAYGVRHGLEYSDREGTAKRALEAIDLTRFRATGTVCEYCKTNRKRNELYVVYNETTGEAIQVGHECLRNYTGLNNPEKVLRVLEQVQEFLRFARGRAETPALSTEAFMTHCATVLRAEAAEYVKGLGHDASRNYYAWLNQERERQAPHEPLWIEPTDQDHQVGATMLKWVREEWDEDGEFATNVKLALASDIMDPRNLGLGGAAFIARKRWLEGAEKRAEAKVQATANAEKQHIGTEGQRETFTLTVRTIKWIEDRYGYTYGGQVPTKPLLIMADPDGNEVKWFASNLPSVADKAQNDWPVEGGTYQVKATVKRHEDHERYGKSTVISRANFQKTISEPEETQDEQEG